MSTARELLDAVQAELAPRDAENRLVPLIAEGVAPHSVFAAIAAEELHIVPSDWRSLSPSPLVPSHRSPVATSAGSRNTLADVT